MSSLWDHTVMCIHFHLRRGVILQRKCYCVCTGYIYNTSWKFYVLYSDTGVPLKWFESFARSTDTLYDLKKIGGKITVYYDCCNKFIHCRHGIKPKVHAQRKFAQGSRPGSPNISPIKKKNSPKKFFTTRKAKNRRLPHIPVSKRWVLQQKK